MMTQKDMTPEMERDAKKFLDIIASVPPKKRFLVALAMESFINGMVAQDRLTEAARPSA